MHNNELKALIASHKRVATPSQLKALAKARGHRLQNTLNRWAAEAQSRFSPTRETEMFIRRKYINRLRHVAESEGLSLRAAHESLMHTFPYTSISDNYAYQIWQHVNRNDLKQRILEAEGKAYRKVNVNNIEQIRVEGGFNWNEYEGRFQYDTAVGGLVGQFRNEETGAETTIILSIRPGEGSDQPSFVEIS